MISARGPLCQQDGVVRGLDARAGARYIIIILPVVIRDITALKLRHRAQNATQQRDADKCDQKSDPDAYADHSVHCDWSEANNMCIWQCMRQAWIVSDII